MDYSAVIRQGEELFSDGQIDQAEAIFDYVIKQQPDNYNALNNLGVIHHHRGNRSTAENHFLKAINVKEDYIDGFLNLAQVYIEDKKLAEACFYLEKCTEKKPNVNLFKVLYQLHSELGNSQKAQYYLHNSKLSQFESEHSNKTHHPEKQNHDQPLIKTNAQPLNLLFVQDAPCIRNYKMATALRSRGHKVSLAYTIKRLSERYRGLSDETYDECIQLTDYRHLWEITKNYDLVHCHNEPDVLTVGALAGDAPVIHDTHDLISLRDTHDPNTSYFEGIANRAATGRIYSTPYQRDEANTLYGVDGPSLIFYNYASESDLSEIRLPKLSRKDNEVHIVYEGGVGGSVHRDFTDLLIELANHNIHIHVYPASFSKEHQQFFSKFPRIHYYQPVSPKEIIEKMTQYDFGIIPFNIQNGNKRFLDSTIANKLFEYLAAGLPVIASSLKSYSDYFNENKVGITFETGKDIVNKIPILKEISGTVDFSRQIYTYENEINRLEEFYYKLLKSQSRPTVQQKVRISSDDLIKNSWQKLVAWIETNGWDGYDPYDIQDYFIQQQKMSNLIPIEKQNEIIKKSDLDPVAVREQLRIPKKRNAKALGLLMSSWVKFYKLTDHVKYLEEAVRIAEWLLNNPSDGYDDHCWGYPFDWQSKIFIPKDTPSAVVSTIVGDGLWELYRTTLEKKYLHACESICRFLVNKLNIDDMGEKGICFSYTPIDDFHVHNANLFCGEFLSRIGKELENSDWLKLAEHTADYAISEQNEDGSIFYWGRLQNYHNPNHLDHYHSGFEIRCLYRMAEHLQLEKIKRSYQKYLEFYLKNYLLPNGTPKISPKNPYPVNIHGAAESILMLSMFSKERHNLFDQAKRTLTWTINNMQTPDGWFGHLWSPNHRVDAPYLRWGQAWMIRAFAEYHVAEKIHNGDWGYFSLVNDQPGQKARIQNVEKHKVKSKKNIISYKSGRDVDIQRPIMIIGVGRSGTTLLQAILNANPEVCIPPESHFIRDFIVNPQIQKLYSQRKYAEIKNQIVQNKFLKRLGVDITSVFRPLEENETDFSLENIYKRILYSYAKSKNKIRVGEKDPSNTIYLHAIREIFPEAIIIHIIRDPRDVLVSRLKSRINYDNSLKKWAEDYVTNFRAGRTNGKKLFGDRYIEIYYEDLISDPRTSVENLCTQIGIKFREEMLDFQENAHEIVSEDEMDWKKNVFKPIMKDNLGKWKTFFDSDELSLIENICNEIFGNLKYERATRIQ